MKQYNDAMWEVLTTGFSHEDRTGNGRHTVPGIVMRFKMADGFPLVSTRSIPFKPAFKEMLCFIAGKTNNKDFNDLGVKFWDSWAVKESDIYDFINQYIIPRALAGDLIGISKEDIEDPIYSEFMLGGIKKELIKEYIGSIGPMYGHVWRHSVNSNALKYYPKVNMTNVAEDKLKKYKIEYEQGIAELTKQDANAVIPTFEEYVTYEYYSTVDQLQQLIVGLKNNPFNSRLLMNVWHPSYIPFEGISPQFNVLLGKGTLAPCHIMVQCIVTEHEGVKRLTLIMYQRSVDLAIGAPSNIAQYALLLHMLAYVTNMEPYELIYMTGDCHLYLNQIELANIQVQRKPATKLPTLNIREGVKSIYDFTADDFEITGYIPHSPITYPLSV